LAPAAFSFSLYQTHAVPSPRPRSSSHRGKLDLVGTLLTDVTRAPGHLGRAAAYLLERPGKRIRARLVLDLADALRLPPEQGIGLAAAVELLHNASLVLDDVQDHDDMRRGHASVWRTFGHSQAINLGTFLIAQSLSLAARLPGASPLFSATLREATTGQAAEVDFHSATPTLGAYEKMAEAKTGALFALAAQAAATLARLPDDLATHIGSAFARLGAAYQVQDDLADAFGLKGRSRAGLDLREGKANSLVLFHLALRPDEQAALLAFLRDETGRADDQQIDAWLQQLFASGAVAAAQEHLHRLCDEITTNSATIPAPFAPRLASLAAGIREPAIFQRTANPANSRGGL